MSSGFLLYKCRQCGAVEKNVHVPDVMIAFVNITMGEPLPKEWGGSVGLIGMHSCSDGRIGVTDLIGATESGRKADERYRKEGHCETKTHDSLLLG
ncbi:hypothetical protein WJ0W_004608 [Paenibacillus melissococcoides]|uniref:Uncharacterized protein n=1 Tax=Paenibacillus melissococcoides TaxID=2912268 RepID=A0ABM9G6L8_9BACL|nr:hypothetical protein [Paenibacillus melissococcoides]CAH8247374.1 hypothetical protein WJ0W_004608 [Paenibacillus melissococcoides]CAH8705334.1 hypothetical protein WDD9_000940 [Paenibacillus melissococcoides]CAH8708555.1 hypothetical protein HTL2_002025 [Paenibacillus melissococcoides]